MKLDFYSSIMEAANSVRSLRIEGISENKIKNIVYRYMYAANKIYGDVSYYDTGIRQKIDFGFVYKLIGFKSKMIRREIGPYKLSSLDGLLFYDDIASGYDSTEPSIRKSPGFIYRSNGKLHSFESIRRIYISLNPNSARYMLWDFFDIASSKIDSFDLKILSNPISYSRHDSCVIYVPERDFISLCKFIQNCISSGKIECKNGEPLGTGSLCNGVAFADEPPQTGSKKISYGEWITSLILSTSLVESTSLQFYHIQERLQGNGWCLNEPYRQNSVLGS